MALPFFTRAFPFMADPNAVDTASLIFGPFPANKIMVRNIRIRATMSAPAQAMGLTIYANRLPKRVPDFWNPNEYPQLFGTPDNGAIALINVPAASGSDPTFESDIPCYYLPDGEYPFIGVQVVATGDSACIGFVAPVIDFYYEDQYSASIQRQFSA